MGKVAKVVGGILVLVVIGKLMDDTPSLTNSLGEAISSGNASPEQWEEYNKVLDEHGRLCVIVAAQEQAKSGAWNPDSISVDYTTGFVNEDYAASGNRNPSPAFSGSVAISGTNAFGGTVKTWVEGYGVMSLEKDGSSFEIRCR
jgi:hypothetical protein